MFPTSVVVTACSMVSLLACACAPEDADSRDALGAGDPSALASQETEADPMALVATSEVVCGLDQVEVAPGSDLVLDWANLTEDMFGDPLPRVPFTDAIATLTSFEGLTTEQVLEGCGLIDNVTIFNENRSTVGLHGDEPTTRRLIPAELMPPAGGIVMFELGGGAIANMRFLLPVAASTTTAVSW